VLQWWCCIVSCTESRRCSVVKRLSTKDQKCGNVISLWPDIEMKISMTIWAEGVKGEVVLSECGSCVYERLFFCFFLNVLAVRQVV
jgi:hypothetical protein